MKLHLTATGCQFNCYMGSQSATCHPTKADTPRLNPCHNTHALKLETE